MLGRRPVIAQSRRYRLIKVWYGTSSSSANALKYSTVALSRRIVMACFSRLAYGFRFPFEKSYSFLIVSTARHTGRAQIGLRGAPHANVHTTYISVKIGGYGRINSWKVPTGNCFAASTMIAVRAWRALSSQRSADPPRPSGDIATRVARLRGRSRQPQSASRQ